MYPSNTTIMKLLLSLPSASAPELCTTTKFIILGAKSLYSIFSSASTNSPVNHLYLSRNSTTIIYKFTYKDYKLKE